MPATNKGELPIPKFLIEANYTSEGLQALVKEKP